MPVIRNPMMLAMLIWEKYRTGIGMKYCGPGSDSDSNKIFSPFGLDGTPLTRVASGRCVRCASTEDMPVFKRYRVRQNRISADQMCFSL